MKTLLPKIIFSLFLLLVVGSSLLVKAAAAADAIPQPGKIPCDPNIKMDPEFNSLRPYQASPCGDLPLSRFCGNTLILFLDNVTTPYCGSEWCPYIGPNPITKKVVVDLKDVELPVLGNTELVKNSQKTNDSIDDATKVNEYVSWYLNGVINRAEYGEGKNTDYELVNFSGPIQKLLPGVIQEAQRIEIIKSATEQEVTTEDDGTQTQNAQNHNQIVVCERLGKPVECYDGGGSKSNGKALRLNDWNEGNLSTINSILNGWFGTEKWNSKIPPLPWQFEKEIYYQKAYNEWRGKTCAIVFDKLVCVELGIVPNKWADLYPYIPLANTVDKKGKEFKTAVHVTAPKAQILSSRYDDIPSFPPNFPLYFAHTKEDFQLAELLKKTYIPQKNASGSADSGSLTDFETIDPKQCRVVNVRSNPGDDVTFDNPESNMGVSIEYTVGDIKCELTTKYECIEKDPVTRECLTYGWVEEWKCESDVYTEIPLELQYPYIDKVWESTTVGADSIFRRIFPKTGEGAPVTCIADVPGETKANYSLDEGNSSPGVELLKVKDPGGNASDNPKLYFPHLGTIYEYFLKGIQTALRPKGYGTPITSGKLCVANQDAGDCSWNINKINQGISDAAAKYKVPESLLRAIFEIESYEWVNGTEEYVCEPRADSGAMGVAQIIQETYEDVTESCQQNMEDVGMCAEYDPKLSRCSFTDAFELMARVLLYKAGRWNTSNCTGSGILESEVQVWYDASCDYYGTHSPDDLTIGLANDIPESSRRPDGDMNYCDIVGYKMGAFPSYPAQ